MADRKSNLAQLLRKNQERLLTDWIAEQSRRTAKAPLSELKVQCQEFLNMLIEATQTSTNDTIDGAPWEPAKRLLAEVSKTRSLQGFSPSETALFVFSLKRPLFDLIQKESGSNPQQAIDDVWMATSLLDQLGLYTTEIHQKTREELIVRQQEDMLELSTPVVKLWDGILALPMIGTLDSSRTQVVMESLLQKIMDTGSEIAIIDITGVPTVDTLVAQHLIKTVTAARLMGAECIISGIRPQIAATIVHLGVDLGGVATKASLADAFKLALHRMGKGVGSVVKATAPAARELRA